MKNKTQLLLAFFFSINIYSQVEITKIEGKYLLYYNFPTKGDKVYKCELRGEVDNQFIFTPEDTEGDVGYFASSAENHKIIWQPTDEEKKKLEGKVIQFFLLIRKADLKYQTSIKEDVLRRIVFPTFEFSSEKKSLPNEITENHLEKKCEVEIFSPLFDNNSEYKAEKSKIQLSGKVQFSNPNKSLFINGEKAILRDDIFLFNLDLFQKKNSVVIQIIDENENIYYDKLATIYLEKKENEKITEKKKVEFKITQPEINDSDTIILNSNSTTFKGALPNSGLKYLSMNNDLVSVKDDKFIKTVKLFSGENIFDFSAKYTDTTLSRTITVISTIDEEGPEIELIKPDLYNNLIIHSNRLKVKVDVSDKSGVQSVYINGKSITEGRNGFYTTIMKLYNGANDLIITATDSMGNYSVRKYKINFGSGRKIPMKLTFLNNTLENNEILEFAGSEYFIRGELTHKYPIETIKLNGRVINVDNNILKVKVKLKPGDNSFIFSVKDQKGFEINRVVYIRKL